MTTATASATDDLDSPLARMRAYVQVFTIHFCEFFDGKTRRYVARAELARANAFMRVLEALMRRVLLIKAALIVPTLPPPRPRPVAAPTQTPAPESAPTAPPAATTNPDRPPSFRAFCQPPQKPRAKAVRASVSRQPLTGLGDLRPLARRFDALMHVIEHPDAAARRLAYRLRPLYTPEAAPQIIDSPQVHPDHKKYLERDLDIWREDANDALRAACPLIVWPAPRVAPTPASDSS